MENNISQKYADYCREHPEEKVVFKHFEAGHKAAQKRIKDKYNHYNSQLKQLTSAKLTKIINQVLQKELEIKVKLLKEILS